MRGQAAHSNSSQIEKVAQVSFEDVINGLQVHKKVMEDLKKRFESTKNDLAQRNAELESLRNRLADQGSSLSDKERESLAAAIAMRTNSLLRDEKKVTDEFHEVYLPLRRKIISKIMDVTGSYAKANSYAVVLETSSSPATRVLWASKGAQLKRGLEEKPWPEIEKKLLTIFSVKDASSITQQLIVACNAEITSLD
jgi:Skp family chaperone for outer membrane proteins